ncbi:MAG: TetR/AcrR family transcriptional regulator [Burkholderiales bacterium]|nr:TetR/AcrR family transcriptional regulator [Burkholderiales bacterium]
MNSPARKPRQRAPTAGTDAKREGILRAAEALFHSQGYERTTIDQIAAALGVTKPYVYYYFHNKQQIFETLSWTPAVACFTVLDGEQDAALPAHEQAARGIERLIRATIAHYPAAFFAYREPQAYRPEYIAEQKRLAKHFYDKLCTLLEAGRASGHLQFEETRITALAACSLPGFLHSWYRPDGRLPPEQVVQVLSRLAWALMGLRGRAAATGAAGPRRRGGGRPAARQGPGSA